MSNSPSQGGLPRNEVFEFGGLHHLALVCRDMAKTVEFYQGVLGMPLVKTLELSGGRGQHFFFDIGNGDTLAFFWFAEAPEPIEGVVTALDLPGTGDLRTAIGSMNHVALTVPAEKFDEYCTKLTALGIEISPIIAHDDSPSGIAEEMHPGVFIRSVYFRDPDGIVLELAAWTRALTAGEALHEPHTATQPKPEPATAAS